MEPYYKWNKECSKIFYQDKKCRLLFSTMLMMPTLELSQEQTYVTYEHMWLAMRV